MATKTLPSPGWSSYVPWNCDTDLKERFETLLETVNKEAIVTHATEIIGETMAMGEAFSAGQNWCCFELASSSGKHVIAKVRLPMARHLDRSAAVNEESELYSIECEIATMQFLRDQKPKFSVPIPEIYAYERPGSERAAAVGAIYMLIEGFVGRTLEGTGSDIRAYRALSEETQAHIVKQWVTIQAELARLAFPSIGSICQYSKQHGPIIGKLSTAAVDGLSNPGPFATKLEYFTTIAEAKFRQACQDAEEDLEANPFVRLGFYIFRNIVQDTDLFKAGNYGPKNPFFHFNHMDMGRHNILVDKDFNFLAIINWESAQSAPLDVNHYPMPFPLLESNPEIFAKLNDSEHIGNSNAKQQSELRRIYASAFRHTEGQLLRDRGAPARPYTWEITEGLGGTPSRLYGVAERLGVLPGWDEKLTYEMVRLAYGYEGEEAKEYLAKMEAKMKAEMEPEMESEMEPEMEPEMEARMTKTCPYLMKKEAEMEVRMIKFYP